MLENKKPRIDIKDKLKEIEEFDIDEENKLYLEANLVYPNNLQVQKELLNYFKHNKYSSMSDFLSYIKQQDEFLYITALKKKNYVFIKALFKNRIY